MVKVKVTRKGDWVFIDRWPKPVPITEELKEIFDQKNVEWFEATIQPGTITLLRTVPA